MAMSILSMSYDRWSGMRCTDTVMDGPSFEQVEVRIRALDENEFSAVSLYRGDDSKLIVGGGAEHGFIVIVSRNDDAVFSTLFEPERVDANPGNRLIVTVGGQPGDYPPEIVVGLPKVLTAVRTFMATGVLDASLSWLPY
jgi:hypothetical protein